MIWKIILIFVGEVLVWFFFIDITFFADWLKDTDPDFDPEKYKPWYKKGKWYIFKEISICVGGFAVYAILFHGTFECVYFVFDCCMTIMEWTRRK